MAKKKNIVRITKGGRLFIKTSDYLRQEKVQKTIKSLLDSEIIKEIEEYKKIKLEEA